MRIIARNSFDLRSGLGRARQLDRQLQMEWEPRLARWQEIQERVRPRHLLGDILIGISAVIIFCSICGQFFVLEAQNQYTLDSLAGFLIQFLVLLSILVWGIRTKAKARKLSGNMPAYKKIPGLPALTELWWQRIEVEAEQIDRAAAQNNPKYGDQGELLLMDALKGTLPDSFFAVRGSKGVEGLDTDVLLFGPNGIWILESKYWSGSIHYDGSRWLRRQDYFLRSGIPTSKERVEKDIHKQWINEYKIVAGILNRGMPGWRPRFEGGLVFTLTDVLLKVDGKCPVSVGKTAGWIKKICSTKSDPAISEDRLLMAIDIILTHSHRYFDDQTFQLTNLAEQLYRQYVRSLISWRRGG